MFIFVLAQFLGFRRAACNVGIQDISWDFPFPAFPPHQITMHIFRGYVLSALGSSGLSLHYIRSPEHRTCPSRGRKARCMQYATCSRYVLVQQRWGKAVRGQVDNRKAKNVARELFTTPKKTAQ